MGTRTGSETRQRQTIITLRLSDDEAQIIRDNAEKAGVSVSSLIRLAVLNQPPPRSARVPNIDRQAVARLLGEFGKIGSNLNQLTKYAHMGRYQTDSIELAIRDLLELRLACLQILGREPENHPANRIDISEDLEEDDPAHDEDD